MVDAGGLSNPKQGTHLVPLARCLVATNGPVLEVGVGAWSTPFLRRYCLAAARDLVSVEEDATWAVEFGVRHARYDFVLPELASQDWSVVLIDHWPVERRWRDAMRFRYSAEYILIHDWNKASKRAMPPADGWTGEVSHDTLVFPWFPSCA